MIPIDNLPIDRFDDGSGKHWCHHCMPAPLDPSLEAFSWMHKDNDHRHIVKDGKITIVANWIMHSWIHNDHYHLIWPDSPDRKFDGKIYAGELPEPDLFEPEPMYYQDTKEGKEWAEWAYNAFLDHEGISNSTNEERTEEDPSLAAAVIAKFKCEREAADEANRSEIIAQTEQQDEGPFDFQCYIPACKFGTNNKKIYERHVVTKHHRALCYPGKVDLKRLGWTAQGRKWEI